jgi:hypothetical protein
LQASFALLSSKPASNFTWLQNGATDMTESYHWYITQAGSYHDSCSKASTWRGFFPPFQILESCPNLRGCSPIYYPRLQSGNSNNSSFFDFWKIFKVFLLLGLAVT